MKMKVASSSLSLFDTHCHLDFDVFEHDRAQVLQDSRSVMIKRILIPAVKRTNWQSVIAMCGNDMKETGLKLYCSVGLHPYWTSEHQAEDIVALKKVVTNRPESVVAIGECGLDAVAAPQLMNKQIELLESQLVLAVEANLPVILHVRKAHSEVQTLLKRFSHLTGVVHGFSGSYELARSYIDKGMKLGVGGTITYARANKTRDAVTRVPLESLVLETDSPDMPLHGYQGQRNSPVKLLLVLNMLARFRQLPLPEVAAQVWQNSIELFRLK